MTYPKEALFMDNEGILLLFIRQVELQIVGRSSGESSTDFNPLSRVEGIRIVGFRCSCLVDPSANTVSPGHCSPSGSHGTHPNDVSVFGIG
jgi:hypothetical protein